MHTPVAALDISSKTKESLVQSQGIEGISSYMFRRRLINRVKKYKVLYNPNHPQFSDKEIKNTAWAAIAASLKTHVDKCRSTWFDLRYAYQRYVRKLRKFLSWRNRKIKLRPVMAYEMEMSFLWPYILNKSNFEKRKSKKQMPANEVVVIEDEDDAIIIDDDLIEIVEVDEDLIPKTNERINSKKITALILNDSMKLLIKLIKSYPELYDITHKYYMDSRRRGLIWNAIAGEMKDKATRCIKFWIQLQTYYEYQISQINEENEKIFTDENSKELEKYLEFLKPHILKKYRFEKLFFRNTFIIYSIFSPCTVYKQSYYLKSDWYEPIEHFKNIFNLLTLLKKFPDILSYFERLLSLKGDTSKFTPTWTEISKKLKDCSAGSCEVTWLLLRLFYWELIAIRKDGYNLQDKWFFESIITDLYSKAQKNENKKSNGKNASKTIEIVAKNVIPTLNDDFTQIIQVRGQDVPESVITSSATTTQQSPQQAIETILSPVIVTAPLQNDILSTNLTSLTLSSVIATPVSPMVIATSVSAPNSVISTSPNLLSIETSEQPIIIEPDLKTNSLSFAPQPCPSVSSPASYGTPQRERECIKAVNSLENVDPGPSTRATAVLPNPSSVINDTSTLNSNEILVELVAKSSGKILIVHGPPLSEKYIMTMTQTADFIREIMSIPVLHQKPTNTSLNVNQYWQKISFNFNLPGCVTKACWNFLKENFKHFHQIAPMSELMAPILSEIFFWKQSYVLFDLFLKTAAKNNWEKYRKILPNVIDEIKRYPVLYADINSSSAKDITAESDQIWPMIHQKYPNIGLENIKTMWYKLKKVFVWYMMDIERGITNEWPKDWFHVFEKMKFLFEQRYQNDEPYYYIVRNKIKEEEDRYWKKQSSSNRVVVDNGKSTITTKEPLLPSQESEITVVSPDPTVGNIAPIIEQKKDTDIVFKKLEIYRLTKNLRKYPEIYEKSSNNIAQKKTAWENLAKDMKMTVSLCRLMFKEALKDYRHFIRNDGLEKCPLNAKFWYHMQHIYQGPREKPILNIRTPSEINELLPVDKFEPGISLLMMHDGATKGLENYASVIQSLPYEGQYSAIFQLNTLFKTWRKDDQI